MESGISHKINGIGGPCFPILVETTMNMKPIFNDKVFMVLSLILSMIFMNILEIILDITMALNIPNLETTKKKCNKQNRRKTSTFFY